MQGLMSLWKLGCTYFCCLSLGIQHQVRHLSDMADITWDLGESCCHLAWQLEAGGISQDILNGTVLLSSVNTESTENRNDTTKDFKQLLHDRSFQLLLTRAELNLETQRLKAVKPISHPLVQGIPRTVIIVVCP